MTDEIDILSIWIFINILQNPNFSGLTNADNGLDLDWYIENPTPEFALLLDLVNQVYFEEYLRGAPDPTNGATYFIHANRFNIDKDYVFPTIEAAMSHLEENTAAMAACYPQQNAERDIAGFPFTYGFSEPFYNDYFQRWTFLYYGNHFCIWEPTCSPYWCK